MHDQRYQSRGIGSVALALVVEHVRTRTDARVLLTSVGQGPASPIGFYLRQGFRATGEVHQGELVLEFDLQLDTAMGVPLLGIEIRPETASEIDDIRDINIEAFRDHPVSRQTEHLIVEALRDTGALEVSLVAVNEGRTVGHIAFSKVTVGDSESGWFLLGPVAVLPGLQGQGIGAALVESGLAKLRSRYANGCVLVGDPGYYSRFGFSTFPDLVYEGVPHEYVLGLSFAEATPRGRVVAHKAFELESESESESESEECA